MTDLVSRGFGITFSVLHFGATTTTTKDSVYWRDCDRDLYWLGICGPETLDNLVCSETVCLR
jgi:hypothetical protein